MARGVRGARRQRTSRLGAVPGAGRGVSEAALAGLAGSDRTARGTADGPARAVARRARRPGGARAAHATTGARRPAHGTAGAARIAARRLAAQSVAQVGRGYAPDGSSPVVRVWDGKLQRPRPFAFIRPSEELAA